jgi:hypothetical protein
MKQNIALLELNDPRRADSRLEEIRILQGFGEGGNASAQLLQRPEETMLRQMQGSKHECIFSAKAECTCVQEGKDHTYKIE